MRKRKKVVLALVAIFLLWGIRVYTVNRSYDIDRIPTENFSIGEWVPYNNEYSYGEMVSGYSICVNSFNIIQCDEFLAEFGKNRDDFTVGEGFGEKVGIVSATVLNVSNQTGQSVNLGEMKLYGKDFYSIQFIELFEISNPDLNGSLGVILEPGESKDVQLVFSFRKEDFSLLSWKKLEKLNLKLFITAFPIQKNIIIQKQP